MKKRIFALALALCMMLSAMPTSFAGNGFLTLDNGEQAPSAPSGILTDDSKAAPQSGVLTVDGAQPSVEEVPEQPAEETPVYGVLTPDQPEEKAPVVQQPVQPAPGVLSMVCDVCGYYDGYHAADCATQQPEYESPEVEETPAQEQTEPVVTIPQEPVVTNYTVETVSTTRTARTLNVARNAAIYNSLRLAPNEGEDTYAVMPLEDKSGESNANVVTDKIVTGENGTYTVSLEAYVTGSVKVESSQKDIPADIVLVLDVSGSMDGRIPVGSKTDTSELDTELGKTRGYYEIEFPLGWYDMWYDSATGKWMYSQPITGNEVELGNSWLGNTVGVQKIKALQTAVDSFVGTVETKAKGKDGVANTADDIDHRIAFVKFAGNKTNTIGNSTYQSGFIITSTNHYSQIVCELTNDYDAITSALNSITPAGATSADYGMEHAASIISAIPSTRVSSKVVIMFTDGEPNHSSGFDASVASSAITASKNIKTVGDVYTVGVFDSDVDTSSGSNVDKYMNYVSSNYKTAESMIVSNNQTDTKYYSSAGNANALEDIFQTISSNIQSGSASIGLDKTTVLVDTVTDAFNIPTNASAVTVNAYKAVYATEGDNAGTLTGWVLDDEYTSTADLKATVDPDNNSVTVTNFDYAKNYVAYPGRVFGDATQSGDFYGRKVVVSFTITPDYTNTLGGEGIETNVGDESGIYGTDGTVYENFNVNDDGIIEVPTVNVPVVSIAPDVQNQNVYLSNQADLKALIESFDSRLNGKGNKGVKVTYNIYKGLEVNDAARVGACTVYPGADIDTGEMWTSLEMEPVLLDCTDYTIVCTVDGDGNGVNPDYNKATEAVATVHVYKPEVTFQDSTIYLSQTPDYELIDAENGAQIGNYQSVVWKHDGTPASEAMGDAPTLVYDYDPANDFTDCTDVDVAVAVDQGKNDEDETVLDGEYDEQDVDVTTHVTFVNGVNSHIGSTSVKEFTVHVLKPSFTVTCTDLYADFGADVTMDEWMIVGDATWSHKCEEVTYPSPSDWAISCNYEYTPADMIKDGKYTMGDEDQAFSVAVTDFTIKDENGNTATYPKAGTVLSDFAVITYKNGETATNAFTIHINKFDLTITKNWGETEAVYQHDVIVALMCGDTKICDVVVPKSDSITITGLICGKDYTLDECENWAWRFTNSVEYSSGNKATHTHALNVSVGAPTDSCSVTAKITNMLNKPYWFDAIAETVKNIFGKGDNQ